MDGMGLFVVGSDTSANPGHQYISGIAPIAPFAKRAVNLDDWELLQKDLPTLWIS
jgi:hypothetical protein